MTTTHSTTATFTVRSPYDGQVVGQCPDMTVAQVQSAIGPAQAALADMRKLTGKQRGALLAEAARRLHQRKEEFARTLTAENGKPITEALGEWNYAIGFFEWFAGEAERGPAGHTLPPAAAGKRWLTLREPLGVAAMLTPWNFPVAMVAKKVPAALAAGCSLLARPSSRTPLSMTLLFDVLGEVGWPAGTLNLITTRSPAAFLDPVFASKAVRIIAFTGSTEVGVELMRRAADTVKHVAMELGGHAPFIVYDDADLEAAVNGLIASKFRNAGQTCICPNRIFVHRPLYPAFAEMLVARCQAMKVGDPMQRDTQIGPLIDRPGYDKVVRHIRDAEARGGRILCGGVPARPPAGEFGCFVAPTVIDDVPAGAAMMCEETFGPVVGLAPFRDEAEAIGRANDSDFGLAGYVYSRDLGRALRTAERLECGVIGVNDGGPGAPQAPFGGMKFSGIGREGGPEGLDEYLQTKFISIGADA